MTALSIREDETDALLDWVRTVEAQHDNAFEAAQVWIRRMGAQLRDDGAVEIGLWAPEAAARAGAADAAVLEVLTPPPDLDLAAVGQTVAMRRETVSLRRHGSVYWGVVEGMRPGTRTTVGSFYSLRHPTADGAWGFVPDHLAASVPFGAFAPAELYDASSLQAGRADAAYWADLPSSMLAGKKDGAPKMGPPQHILQVHPGTATESGTLAALSRLYRTIARKHRAGTPLTPTEQNFDGFDAVQLMPVEPTIGHEAGPAFWAFVDAFAPDAPEARVCLRAPDITDWGYDIALSASSAVNPSILETKRPDELVEFAATLHTMPNGPVRLIFDVVFGHTDNQAVDLLNEHVLAGPGMYGMNVRFRHPMTRALLLEMQRRKGNFGADGLRVDGAQDFRYWDPETERLYYDDAFLREMSDVAQTTAGTTYYPWMIFEDGRPWPRDDWELSSTYRAVIEDQPDEVFQWGPLTFAHNTPFLFTFWVSKWWRLRELFDHGEQWISGCANHDTLRRGAQVDPQKPINTFLGDTLPEIIRNAYDNPATTLLTYGLLPGVPMEFTHALMRAPWSFIRNTDDRYGVKVVSEEAFFLAWRVTPEQFQAPEHFSRLKALGFDDLATLRRFLRMLDHAVQSTDYALPAVSALLQAAQPPFAGVDLSVDGLKRMARAWMDDLHDYCSLSHWADRLDERRTQFTRSVRTFRREYAWLRERPSADAWLRYREPCNGTVLVSGWRRGPTTATDACEVLFVGNLEGRPAEVVPSHCAPEGERDGWAVALRTPDLEVGDPERTVTLSNSEALLLVRRDGP